jgi:hypothetical protein
MYVCMSVAGFNEVHQTPQSSGNGPAEIRAFVENICISSKPPPARSADPPLGGSIARDGKPYKKGQMRLEKAPFARIPSVLCLLKTALFGVFHEIYTLFIRFLVTGKV